MEDARAAARRIGGSTSFGDAVATGEIASPVELEERALSPEVRGAVAGLEPGEVSQPVEVHGGVFLFRLERRSEGGADERAILERGREDLLRERGRLASEALLRRLRDRFEVTIHERRLPFVYVPPEDAS
jgi:hypothetical protein